MVPLKVFAYIGFSTVIFSDPTVKKMPQKPTFPQSQQEPGFTASPVSVFSTEGILEGIFGSLARAQLKKKVKLSSALLLKLNFEIRSISYQNYKNILKISFGLVLRADYPHIVRAPPRKFNVHVPLKRMSGFLN